jgi:hypothetical protein
MVYMPPGAVGWRPFARSWLQALPLKAATTDDAGCDPGQRVSGWQPQGSEAVGEAVPPTDCAAEDPPSTPPQPRQQEDGCGPAGPQLEPVQEFLWSLLDAWVDPLLAWVRARGKEAVATVDVGLVQAAATLLGRLLETEG